jgi:hypothetical protein
MEAQERQGARRSQRDYSLAYKLQVVSEVEKGELSYIARNEAIFHL